MTHPIRVCKDCGKTSDETDFYDGVPQRCKACHKRRVNLNRQNKVDYYREYDRRRYKEDPRVRARHRRYAQTDRGKAARRRADQKWRRKNADKRAAHVILGNAVKAGRVVKPDRCSRCGSGGRIHGHHSDYAKPLDVTWLCSTCHRKEHK